MTAQFDTRYDAVVIGAGHNGLTCALYLATNGIQPLVVERNATIGGAVRSAELTEPGFIHDVYSTNQNLFLQSSVYDDYGDELAAHGLEFSTTEKPFCNVFPDGSALRIYSDTDRTNEELRNHSVADAEGWQELHDQFGHFQRTLLPLYEVSLPSASAVRAMATALHNTSIDKILADIRIVLSSTRELGTEYFETPEARALMACWGMHLDFGPDVSGGGMFPFVESFSDLEAGVSVATGGASSIVEALAGVLREAGGEVWTNAEVTQVVTDDDRAIGVEIASGDRIGARTAVIGNLTPTVLFDDLLSHHSLPNRFEAYVDGYEYGPGTMMIHLALDDLPEWNGPDDIDEFAYVHIAPYVEDLAETYTDSLNGLIPKSPFLVVGQTTAVDPSRTPDTGEILWIQVRTLPSTIEGDAAHEIEATNWDDAKTPVADRVIDKLEAYAPDVRELVRERAVLSPVDLERNNPNLHGGDSVTGSHHLRQNFLWRPFPGWSTYRMPIENLYMIGAATWPGAGNNATSGQLAAQRILNPGFGTKSLVATEKYIKQKATAVRNKLHFFY
ncbi:phytoene desaturase family protein [Halocatena marina]|uniref:phytoene desaturase family protein n=1 Tax=Halocatena marina TaxID=2934937 RepID=UPI00200BCE89|nr:NAD(P)/FAD-dependent oxidoreductase [Halocatena marina]